MPQRSGDAKGRNDHKGHSTEDVNSELKRAARGENDDDGVKHGEDTSEVSEVNKQISRPQKEEGSPVTGHAGKPGALRGSPD